MVWSVNRKRLLPLVRLNEEHTCGRATTMPINPAWCLCVQRREQGAGTVSGRANSWAWVCARTEIHTHLPNRLTRMLSVFCGRSDVTDEWSCSTQFAKRCLWTCSASSDVWFYCTTARQQNKSCVKSLLNHTFPPSRLRLRCHIRFNKITHIHLRSPKHISRKSSIF